MIKKLSFLAIAFCLVTMVIAPICVAEDEGSAIGQADKGYFYYKNVSGTTIYDGELVYHASATTVNYGDDVRLGADLTSSQALVAGVAMGDIPNDAIGTVQVRGYHDAVRVWLWNKNLVIGEKLIPARGYGYLMPSEVTTSSTVIPNFVALETAVVVANEARYGHDSVATPPTVKCMINLW